MRLLLDTHTIIWFVEQNPLLGIDANKAIKDDNNHIFISVVSIWELSIKVSLGKLALPKAVSDIASDL